MAQIPTRNISQFKSKLIGGGARPNLFEVNVTFPEGLNLNLQGDGTGEQVVRQRGFHGFR